MGEGSVIEIVAFSIIAFIGGFLTMWYILDDLGSDVVIFTDDAELQELCWNGLRKGEP